MQELVNELLTMPRWVQVAMALFVFTFVWSMAAPRRDHRRARERFRALAQSHHAAVSPGHDEFAESFGIEHLSRSLTIRRELRAAFRGSSYRGPLGHLLIVETPLAGNRWQQHGVDIVERTGLARALPSPTRSGDGTFDARFVLRQDGVPVREGWLDASTRAAVSAFFDLPAVGTEGRLWVQEGRLQYLCDTPDRMDAAGLTAVLGPYVALATALERTAGWRGPTA